MIKKLMKGFGLLCCCTLLTVSVPVAAMADVTDTVDTADAEYEPDLQEEEAGEAEEEGAGVEDQAGTELLVRVDDNDTDLYAEPTEDSDIVGQAETGATYTVLEQVDDQWLKISTGDAEGYINTVKTAATVTENVDEVEEDSLDSLRQELVEYGLQFVGNRYKYGGTDPNTGVDCSGFTRYVVNKVLGITLPHSSRGQASLGTTVSADEMKPGDLVFYSSGGRIDHVALYIGNGQIVHASSKKTGIKISTWNSRKPVKIVNILGDI